MPPLCYARLTSLTAVSAALDRHRPEAWLGEGECATFASLRHPLSRALWLAGRWAAKSLLAEVMAGETADSTVCHPGALYIQSRDARSRQVRPRVHYRGRLQPWSLSISHCESAVLVAVCTAGTSLGADVVEPARVRPALVRSWYTPAEKRWIASSRDPLAAAKCWAIKEAAYKALNHGEPFSPRMVEVGLDGDGGYRLSWRNAPLGGLYRVEVRQVGPEASGLIAALVIAGDASRPHWDLAPQYAAPLRNRTAPLGNAIQARSASE